MIEVSKTSRIAIREKLWLWRSRLFFFTVIGYIISINFSHYFYIDNQLAILKAKQTIAKVEIKIGSDSPVTYLTLLDRKQLDTINLAFQTAQKKYILKGGIVERWAEVNVYKSNKKVNLFITYTIRNGWMMVVGNRTFTSDYLFALVRRYSKQK